MVSDVSTQLMTLHQLIDLVFSFKAHINNLYNTTFWALVQRGKQTHTEAHASLKGTFSRDKHSILFDKFQINYNAEPEIFKKGSILLWSKAKTVADPPPVDSKTKANDMVEESQIILVHEDLIKDQWWECEAGAGLLL